MRLLIALLIVCLSAWVLERARTGVAISRIHVGDTPVTAFAQPGAEGPNVVIAHGFAGSSQMMQGYALPLARAGYRVHAFDFKGHGRHPVPMSGDVTSVDGTTRLLVDQTEAVIAAVATGGTPVTLVGHSMATDILVRVAARRGDTGTIALLSAFSREIDATTPKNMLLVVGAWEPGLREFALEAARMVDPEAREGMTVTRGEVMRRATVAPWAEHVSILQSRAGRRDVLNWIDAAYDRTSDVHILPTGPAILGLLGGLVWLFGSLVRLLPSRDVTTAGISRRQLAAVALVPPLVAPPLALVLDQGFLPVLVADFLSIHLAIYGGVQLVLLRLWRVPLGWFSPGAFLLLLVACAAFGVALDRYAANFWPTPGRLWIIAIMSVGAVLFFVADARLAHLATVKRRLMLRGAFLVSLLFAVALDFSGLFFLLMIAPVIVVFYLIFGTLARAASARSGPLAPGFALGLMLAWALGVSFPLFQA